jgi:heam-based aerotactic trancducer
MSQALQPDDLKRLAGIDAETIRAMRDAAFVLKGAADRAVTVFYGRVERMPDLAAIIARYSSVDALSATLRRYVLDFGTTELGEEHVASRRRIAGVHDRIDLPIEAYTMQVQALREVWTLCVEEAIEAKKLKKPLARYTVALDKMLTFDEAIVTQTFMSTRQTRVEEAMREAEERQETQTRIGRELSDLAAQLAAAAQQASASVEEMTVTAERVAGDISQANEQGLQATQTAAGGLDAIEAADRAVVEVRQASTDLSSSAADLEQASARIGQIASVLEETAGQINLLALNAAIEAARAGEAGRGFAVVADEVRKLAEATRARLQETSSAVAEVDAAIAQVRRSGETAARQVDEMAQAATGVRSSFEEITGAVGASGQALEAVAAASQQVAAAAGETGRASGEVANLAEHVKEIADSLVA